MTKATSANLALIGPKRPPERVSRGIPLTRVERFSFDSYLATLQAPDRVVLCPRGENVEADLAFLRAAKTRLLWPAPPPDIAGAIAGLVTDTALAPNRSRARRAGPLSAALLLEGGVTLDRARAALASPERLWIVESVRRARLSEADLDLLNRAGVRWAALRPVELVGLVASPALARARSRWKRWLGSRLPVWAVS